jgi:DNA mismatch endonuclease, patch repair protein
MDRISKEARSRNMSRIRGKDTRPEMTVRQLLFSKGIRYRIHPDLPGKPDIAFFRTKVCVFINGCFWHRHAGCKNSVVPKTNTEFWVRKIAGNVERDGRNYSKLAAEGWRIAVIWECEIEKYPLRIYEKIKGLVV